VVGDTLVLTPHRDSVGDLSVQLTYTGGAVTASRGARTGAGVPMPFGYSFFEPRQSWSVRVFAWTDSTDPRSKPAAFDALVRGTPLMTRVVPRLDWMWSRPNIPGIPATRMALDATTRVRLAPGTYTLRTLSDDAIRVWVDGKLVIDHWTPHETLPDYTTMTGGAHEIRVQHVQVEGWTELRVDFLRGVQPRSSGSAGPH
jgi:hypothetical protein